MGEDSGLGSSSFSSPHPCSLSPFDLASCFHCAMEHIKAITFDVGGTLIRPWPSVGAVYAGVAAEYGYGRLDIQGIDRQFAAAWKSKGAFSHQRNEWQALVNQSLDGMVPIQRCHEIFPSIYRRFAEPTAWKLFEDVTPTLHAASRLGLRLAVISNWDERLRPLLTALNLTSFFETMTISCESASAKPSPDIFKRALNSLKLKSEHVLHVGDHPREDFAAARAAGMHALLIDRTARSSPQSISSLNELTRCRPGFH